jgi:soluble lytic murein transglycosylase
LLRALYAIQIGLRPEGVREWNYATNLHDRNGMNDRELLAAADLACQREVWDRCINTSERTKSFFDAAQRFPMPHRAVVLQRSRDIGLDPAYVYGLIRQESRFVTDARSGVGASGLMQVMPATARWTAKKIGMTNFNPEQLADRDTNIAIGSGYLKLVLDSFEGSMPLAAAAYNAGPTRPRAWRNGPVVEGAIWAENVPFNETRDYVKKVLANTTQYAAVITGQPQSLKARLGYVGPAKGAAAAEGRDLP